MGSKTEYFEEEFHESGKVEYEEYSGKCEAFDEGPVSGKIPVPQDIPGEYCAYCQYKIAEYCKTHEVVDSSVKFCPNCGNKRITYRLNK